MITLSMVVIMNANSAGVTLMLGGSHVLIATARHDATVPRKLHLLISSLSQRRL